MAALVSTKVLERAVLLVAAVIETFSSSTRLDKEEMISDFLGDGRRILVKFPGNLAEGKRV